jgi:hypothetical protein
MPERAHVFIIVLTVAALAFILRLVRGQRLKAKYSLLWLSVGGLMLVLAIVPGVIDTIADRLGVDYQPALFLLLGLGFLLLVVVHLSFELSRMENRVRSLAEEVTFLRHDLRDAQDELDKSQGRPLDPHRQSPGS